MALERQPDALPIVGSLERDRASGVFIALLLVAALGVVGGRIWAIASGPLPPGAGRAAPDFTAPRLDGAALRLADLKGKVVLLDFWATWCPPCVAAMPSLDRLHRELGDQGLVVLGVNVEPGEERVVRAFVAERNIGFPVVVDPGAVSRDFGVFSYPTSFLLDRDGTIRAVFRGPVSEARLREAIGEALASGGAAVIRPAALPLLLDQSELDLESVAGALRAESAEELGFDLSRWLDLSRRLPSGLIQADAIWLTAIPPVGLSPLAPGSSWYALDRALVAALPPGRAILEGLTLDLGRYALAAAQVRARAADHPQAIEALIAEGPIPPERATELALLLDADAGAIAALDPAARRDLGAMARVPFAPRVRLHASTRPANWRRLGASIGKRIAEAAEGPLRLLVTDAVEAIEHLSPYPRDLARELVAWAAENPSEISTPGLGEALARNHADGDLPALVVRDLVRGRPEILEERRRVERSCGLDLLDEAGMAFGVADLGLLASPDPRAVPAGARGRLVVIAGPSAETLLEATRVLLDTGRVGAAALALGAGGAQGVEIPEVVISAEDGAALDGATRLLRRAEGLGIACRTAPKIEIDEAEGAPALLLDLMSLWRRAEVLGAFPAAGRRAVVLYPAPIRGQRSLEHRLFALDASRLAIASISAGELLMPHRGGDAPKQPGSLRFRA